MWHKTQTEGCKDIEYLPTSVIQDGAPIIFETGKDKTYSDLSEVEIQGVDGTSLEGKQFTNATEAESLVKVGLINNLARSLLEQIVLIINDEKVTENSPYYAYKAILEILLSYDEEAGKSVLRLSCFKKGPQKCRCHTSNCNPCQ